MIQDEINIANERLEIIVNRIKSQSLILNVLNKIPFVFWIKDEHAKMVYMTPLYISKYIKPLNKNFENYLGNDDVSFWGKKIGSIYYNNDIRILKSEVPEIVKEPIAVGGYEYFIKFVIEIDSKKYIAGMQVGGSVEGYIEAFNLLSSDLIT